MPLSFPSGVNVTGIEDHVDPLPGLDGSERALTAHRPASAALPARPSTRTGQAAPLAHDPLSNERHLA